MTTKKFFPGTEEKAHINNFKIICMHNMKTYTWHQGNSVGRVIISGFGMTGKYSCQV